MGPIWCVYTGGGLALTGFLAAMLAPRVASLPNWRWGASMAFVGAMLVIIGGALPAPDRRVRAIATQLDVFVPAYQFDEVHTIWIDAPPERVFAALKAVTADEIFLFQTLTWIRRFGRSGAESILNVPGELPILEVATRTTFVALAEIPSREIVIGTVVVAPPGARIDRTASAFEALHAAGYAKAAMNFLLEPVQTGTRLTTMTRVAATDARAARKFAWYWRVIYPGSALIRRMWLRAVKRRAEQGVSPVFGTK